MLYIKKKKKSSVLQFFTLISPEKLFRSSKTPNTASADEKQTKVK